METMYRTTQMKQAIALCFIGWLCLLPMMGQTTLRGKIVDEKNCPIAYANLVLLSLPDSTFVQGTVSEMDGKFAFASTAVETGVIRISCIGYSTLYVPVQAKKEWPDEIRLDADAQQLGEVVVRGTPPRTQMKGGSLLTSVAGTVLEKAGTAENLLDRIPGVSTSQGSVHVFGRGVAEVYINGRKVRDESELDRLASNDIKSVEVINNPSARYAATVQAVVRIVTKRAQGEGWGFNNRTQGTYNKEWSWLHQFNVNYRTGGLDLTGMVMGSDRRGWSKKDITQQTYLDKTWKQNSYIHEKEHSQHLYAMLSANYVFHKDHSIGARYNLVRQPRYDSWGGMDSDVHRDEIPTEQLRSRYDSRDRLTRHSLNVYYVGQWKGWEIDFNTDVLWSENGSSNRTDETIEEMPEMTTVSRKVDTHTVADNRLYAGKLILSRSVVGGDLSVGGEYVRTIHGNEFQNPQAILQDDNSEVRENNIAGFVEYSRTLGPLFLQAGLRFEHISSDYDEQGVRNELQSKQYNHWFPTVVAMLPMGDVQLSLSYKSDILRPSYHELRPNLIYNNRYTYESGNPLLRPQLAQNLILNAVYDWVQLTAGYKHTRDAIVMASTPYASDEPTIALLKTVNAPAYDNLFASLSLSPTIAFWSPQFTATVSKQWFSSETPWGVLDLQRPFIHLSWDNSLQLPKGFMVNADIAWGSTGHSENIKMLRSNWSANLMVYKSWKKNRWTCQLHVTDVFNTGRACTLTYLGALQTLQTHLPAQSRSASLTVRYRFNTAKNKYKGTGAGDAQKSRM